MMLKRSVILAAIGAASLGWAQVQNDLGGNVIAPGAEPAPGNTLAPRKPLRKPAVAQKPAGGSRLAVKFADAVKFRADAQAKVVSRAAVDVSGVQAVANQYNLTFVPGINRNEQDLAALQNKAAARSNRAQPDLAGIMYVEFPAGASDKRMEEAAQALNALAEVEIAYFQREFKPHGGGGEEIGACCIPDPASNEMDCAITTAEICENQGGQFQGVGTGCPDPCPTLGACCLNEDDCVAETEAGCAALNGVYKGDFTNCEGSFKGDIPPVDCTNQECGDPANGNCFLPHDGQPGNPPPGPWCDDLECCELVGDIYPFCINEPDPPGGNWDQICAWIAHLVCACAPPCFGGSEIPPPDGPIADRCATPLGEGCFEVNQNAAGCSDPGCCVAVCSVESFCCEGFWDSLCVEIAEDVCINPSAGGPTPDFVPLQGYLRPNGYLLQPEPPATPPPGLAPPAPFPPFGGQGYNLFGNSVLEDDPDDMEVPQRYQGLYGLSRELFERYGIGATNPPGSEDLEDLKWSGRGRGVKVAVIEWAYYENHEDLNVITEPGQTLIMIDDVSFPSHATACLGIINAKPNGKGVTGIAPDAKTYFFPLTSVEEGPRALTAFTNCYSTLGPGDVVSCSFGPFGNLNNDPLMNSMIRLGTDLGILTCVSAGNDCFNLDDMPEDVNGGIDNGCVVVGACFPGVPFCRLSFSNHYESSAAGDSRHVDVSAWGTGVTTTGHDGNLWLPNGNVARSYTNSFGGTSAACPMVAGVAACLSGLAQQFYDIPIPVGDLKAAVGTGYLQCLIPNPDDLPGFDEGFGCSIDVDPEEEPNRISNFTEPRGAGANVLNQSFMGFDESPLIDDIMVIRGTHLFGNRFSIKASDGAYYVVHSLFTHRKFSPPLPPPAGLVKYYGTGQTVDVMVTARTETKTASTMTVTTEMQLDEQFTFLFVEMFDWVMNRWSFVDFQQLDLGPEVIPCPDQLCFEHPVISPNRFINPTNRQVLIRLYTLHTGVTITDSQSDDDYNFRLDHIDLVVGNGFGPGGGGGVLGP